MDAGRGRVAHDLGNAGNARQVDAADPPHDGVVDDKDVDCCSADAVAENQNGEDDGDDRADQPADARSAEITRQRLRSP